MEIKKKKEKVSFANNTSTYAARPKRLFLFSAGEVRTGHLELDFSES